MKNKNLILSDCDGDEINDFVSGLKESINEEFEVKSKICSGKHSFFNNIIRYLIYIFYPVKFVFHRKKYNYIIGWQQFFAIFFIFYSKLFNIKKENIIVICNFTYKSKKGIIGKIYYKFMQYCLDNEYLDYIHVPSQQYAEICSKEFKINIDKFIIVAFGLTDTYDKWKNSKVEYENYSLAIGRSNRDYDFLVNVWKLMPENENLLIISDQYKPKEKLPENIILRDNIVGKIQFPYIANCKTMIIPIKDENICSGDTVLLKAMSYYKPVVVTKPSTLSEMYIENNKNGLAIEKNEEVFSTELKKFLNDNTKMKQMADTAREGFIRNFSRENMGRKIGKKIIIN